MHAPGQHSILLSWRGQTVLLTPPPRCYWAYRIHFHERLAHAGHYTGSTGCLDARLHLHKSGRGAKLMKAVSKAGISWEVCQLWRFRTYEEARAKERQLKRQHNAIPTCPLCQGKSVDEWVFMRQGHRRLARPMAKRRPMLAPTPRFVRRQAEQKARNSDE